MPDMVIKLTADIIEHPDAGYTGWFNEIKGIVAQGKTLEEVKTELFKLLRIKWEIERENQRENGQSHQTSESVTREEFNLALC